MSNFNIPIYKDGLYLKGNKISLFSLFLIFIVIFTAGFFVGYIRGKQIAKTQADLVAQNVIENELSVEKQNTNQNSESNQNLNNQKGPEETKKTTPEISKIDIFWIKPSDPPNCPDSHPIKAKVNSDSLLYYASSSKSYARVRPHLCFASEEIAINSGFIKKF